MATATFTPFDHEPDHIRGGTQTVHCIGAQTVVLAARGQGHVHGVIVGVVGTLLKLYDTPAGGITDYTTQIATVDISVAVGWDVHLESAFGRGCTAIITGGAATEVTITGRFGKAQKSQYHYPVR